MPTKGGKHVAASCGELRIWAGVVYDAGYAGVLFVEYLMDEFSLPVDVAEDVAADAQWASRLVPVRDRTGIRL